MLSNEKESYVKNTCKFPEIDMDSDIRTRRRKWLALPVTAREDCTEEMNCICKLRDE